MKPIDRLRTEGARALSDAEILALVTQTPLAKAAQLVDLCGSLAGVVKSLDLAEADKHLTSLEADRLRAAWEMYSRTDFNGVREESQDVDILCSSRATRKYLVRRFHGQPHESFNVLYMTNQHQVITISETSKGTIDGAAVYPREIVKDCLKHNAAAVIFAHNHPSGVAEPSQADIAITAKLTRALGTIEIRVLDHLVIGGSEVVSMAERGLLLAATGLTARTGRVLMDPKLTNRRQRLVSTRTHAALD